MRVPQRPTSRYASLTHQEWGKLVPKCPECDADVTVGSDAVKGEIVSCPDCGAELEVTATTPVALALAPEAEEDWGE
jgi:alpha-aminoadipate carrier protein LysW